jgi:transcriptional regulator with XRE-family HTH domain
MRWEDIQREWLADPEFREALDLEFPYRELSLEIGGLRADLEMTQTEFGRLVGVPQSTIARLESGKQAPSVATLKRIAKATGAELVIEFRRPKRKRRAKSPKAAASSPGNARPSEPLAASGTGD